MFYRARSCALTGPRKLERTHEILGLAEFDQGNYESAIAHFSSGDVVNNMYTKYHLAVAHENAGDTAAAGRLFDELAVWNFNGPGYAMLRADILARAAAS